MTTAMLLRLLADHLLTLDPVDSGYLAGAARRRAGELDAQTACVPKRLTMPLEAKFVPLETTPEEMAYRESAEEMRDWILEMFKVPKEMFEGLSAPQAGPPPASWRPAVLSVTLGNGYQITDHNTCIGPWEEDHVDCGGMSLGISSRRGRFYAPCTGLTGRRVEVIADDDPPQRFEAVIESCDSSGLCYFRSDGAPKAVGPEPPADEPKTIRFREFL